MITAFDIENFFAPILKQLIECGVLFIARVLMASCWFWSNVVVVFIRWSWAFCFGSVTCYKRSVSAVQFISTHVVSVGFRILHKIDVCVKFMKDPRERNSSGIRSNFETFLGFYYICIFRLLHTYVGIRILHIVIDVSIPCLLAWTRNKNISDFG